MKAPLWLVERSCTRKRCYRTKAQARAGRVLAEQAAQKKLRIYQCPICGWWHLASRKGGEEE